MAKTKPTSEEIRGWFTSLSNWGRWGKEDQMGTLNLITPEKRMGAFGLVKKGRSVTLSRPIVAENSVDARVPPQQYTIESGEGWESTPEKMETTNRSASEYIGMVPHGFVITHVDSLSHIFLGGQMYNGWPAHKVLTRGGATVESIDLLKDGVITRGVLLDMPTLKGVDYMQPGEALYPEDLEAAEQRFNVKVQSGDALFIRTGNWERRNALGPENPHEVGSAGMQAACLPWIKSKDIALLGGDMASNVIPSGYEDIPMPIHQVMVPVMGCWLIDNCNFEGLAAMCKEEGRYEFLAIITPLRLATATGAPANPIAVF